MKQWFLMLALLAPLASYAEEAPDDLQVVIDEIKRLQAENEALLAYKDCADRDLVYRPEDPSADEMGCVEFTVGTGAAAAPQAVVATEPVAEKAAEDSTSPLPRAKSIPLSELPRVKGDMPATATPQIPLKAEPLPEGARTGVTLPASAPQLPTCGVGEVLSTDAEGQPICVSMMQSMPANQQELPGNACAQQSVFVQTDYNNTRFHFRVPMIRDGETRESVRKTFVASFTCNNGRLSLSRIVRKECGGTSLWKTCEESQTPAHEVTYECPGLDNRCYALQANGRLNKHLFMRAHIVRQR